tara:strand:+ start:58 stop:423 length:366 start_codon:yes stop_codon:yes gene_type:complete
MLKMLNIINNKVNMEKELLNQLLKESFTQIEVKFRACDIPRDCEIIQRRPPLPIYHLCWVDNLAEHPIELKTKPVRMAKTPLDNIVFTSMLIEHHSQIFQAQYIVRHLKRQNRDCYVRQRL